MCEIRRLSLMIGSLLISGTVPTGTTAAQDTTQIRMVQIGGRAMRVRVSGLDNRAPGSPLVVLEAGGFGGVDSWGAIFTRIAALTPVIAYDRRGLGQSEPDGERPTPDHVAATLHGLLLHVAARPPYVLVGHSWGGPLIRVFAGRYPQEVAGMVYLDATNCESTAEELLAILREAGGREEDFVQLVEGGKAATAQLPAGQRATAEIFEKCNSGASGDLIPPRPIPDVPVAVLIGAAEAKRDPKLPLPVEVDGAKLASAWHRLRLERQTAWALASTEGLLLVSSKAGHYIHRDDPELTMFAIRHVLARAR